jgi:hypothetical protein
MRCLQTGRFNIRLTKDVTNIIFRIEKQKEARFFFIPSQRFRYCFVSVQDAVNVQNYKRPMRNSFTFAPNFFIYAVFPQRLVGRFVTVALPGNSKAEND